MININQNELNFLKLQGLQLQPAAGNSNHYACVKLFISEICVNIDFDDWGDFFTVSFAFFFSGFPGICILILILECYPLDHLGRNYHLV